MEKTDKEIVFSEEAQIKWAELMAKCLMPEPLYLKELSDIQSDTFYNYDPETDRWTFEIKKQ